jgi:glycosyltransferase involved in cell wall biosynthesis
MNFTFSLIIPTINRSNELEVLLDSLRNQTYKNFEVIIVDQNQDNRILSIINDYTIFLKIVHKRTNKKGASSARNTGIELANGDVFTFPDDDCEYDTHILEKVNKFLNDNSSLDGITVTSHEKGSTGKVARLSRKQGFITKYNVLKCVIEFGIFIKRTSLKNVRFDENLGVGAPTPWWSDEGPDLIYRLIGEGCSILYLPEIVIFHPNPVKRYDEHSFQRSYRYGCGRGRFLKKHQYPFWFFSYICALYIAGFVMSLFQFKLSKAKYYLYGLKGRIEGYIN